MAIKDKWLIFISQFLGGYETIIVLEEEEKNALPLMMQCIELLFVVFWQQQENQEAAQETVEIYKFIGICQALNQFEAVGIDLC